MAGDPALSWRFQAEALAKSGLAKMPFASCPVADRSAARPDVPLYAVPAYVYHAPWGLTSQGALYALMWRRYMALQGATLIELFSLAGPALPIVC